MTPATPITIEQAIADLAATLRAGQAIPQSERLWDKPMLLEYFGVSASTLERCIVSAQTFPEPIRIPGGPLRYKASEVMAWAGKQRGARRIQPRKAA